MNKALQIIEEVYDIALNPTQDYFAQLEPLAPNGELANRISANKVLFKLCQLVDAQDKEIQALKQDRVDIANKLVGLQDSLNSSSPIGKNTSEPVVDAPSSDPTKPITNTDIQS
jgi:hypothetical protein